MDDLLIASPSGVPLPVTPERLLAAIEDRWPGRTHISTPSPNVALTVWIEPEDDSAFSISLNADSTSIWSDGTPEQNVDTAVWIRSLLPDGPRIVAFNSDWTWHVELVPGMTRETYATSVIDHSVPGWNAADAELS